METRSKRIAAFSVAALYMFLGGCDFAIIFPTIWNYLQSLGVEHEYCIGFVVSAYSFSGAIAGIIGGRLADKYASHSHTKAIVLITAFTTILGSVQYALGFCVWNLLIARLVCGLSAAAGSAMIAQVCRATEPDERTPVLAICNAARQCGILFGPVFQLGLQTIDFYIGSFHVNSLNSTGIFMAIFWLLFSIYAIFMLYDLTPYITVLQRVRTMSISPYREQESSGDEVFQNFPTATVQLPAPIDTPIVSEILGLRNRSFSERLLDSLDVEGLAAGEVELVSGGGIGTLSTVQRYKDEFLTDSFVALVGMTFTLFFSQVAVETAIQVIIQTYFGYGVVESSFVFMAGGIESLIMFVAVACLSQYVKDTTLLIIGWSIMILAQIWLMAIVPFIIQGNKDDTCLALYIAGIVLLYLGYPIATSATTGLFSKLCSNETQGLGQGLRRVFSYLGLIYGPLWSGSSMTRPLWSLGVPLSILLINFAMFAFSYKKLKKIEARGRRSPDGDNLMDSTSSLISS